MSQPWQPRYDPGAHQRRIDDGVPPQGYSQPGWQQPPPQPWQAPPPPQFRPPPRRRRRGGAGIVFGVLCGIAAVIFIAILAAEHGATPQPSPAATGAPATGPAATTDSQAAPASTVTYVVTGSSADVTYGPAGSDSTGSVPMHKTVAIGATPASYYAISAQLNGGGSVTCEILVSGRVVSKATATGSYQIAQCEIVQDPLTGDWQDANSA